MAKYYWAREDEAKLLELWRKGITNVDVLAKELERKPRAVEMKLRRLGVVAVKPGFLCTTTTEVKGKGLLTHEEALKLLAGVLDVLSKSGQDKLELQRLRILVDALQTYDSVLEKFEGWVEVENRLVEMEKKIQELQMAQKVQS
jgi:chromosome condensin MukBEF MukE localization factor